MTEDQFNKLSEDEQSDVISKKAVLISVRRTAEYRILLYQIESFYAEIFYHPTANAIKIKSFSSTENLQPYLSQISLNGLV